MTPAGALAARLVGGCAASRTMTLGLPSLSADATNFASCSYRTYASQGTAADDQQQPEGLARTPRGRRPTRHGSKLAMRDPERFLRMRTVLGYPGPEDGAASTTSSSSSGAAAAAAASRMPTGARAAGTSSTKVGSVTISLLQTMKYLFEHKDVPVLHDRADGEARRAAQRQADNNHMLEGIAAYKVTTLNRELVPLLGRTEAYLSTKPPGSSGAVPSFLTSSAAAGRKH